MSETLKSVRSYMDQNLESQQVTVEGTFDAFPDQAAALAGIPNDQMLVVLNNGFRKLIQDQLYEKAGSQFPADAISEEAYNGVQDTLRPRLELELEKSGKEVNIKNLRELFKAKAKSDPRIKAMIVSMGEMLKVTI